jgi:hypothetical protein
LRDEVPGIIFEIMTLAYPLVAFAFAGLPRKKRIAGFLAARSTAPNPKGGPR